MKFDLYYSPIAANFNTFSVLFEVKGVVNLAEEKTFFKFQHAEKVVNNGGSGAIYGLGILGAFIYFMQHADGFWAVIWGIVQAVFWPAVLVYKALELLKL